MPDNPARRSSRKPVALALLILVDAEGDEAEARAHDLSLEGMGITCDSTLKTGQLVDIRANEGLGGPLRARVVWVGQPESDKQCPAGLEFLSPLKAAT